MATSIWGLLKESLISSKTIREAIADMIADHEADPTAHLSETGSLQSHKASEIIDHEAASILQDKLARKFSVNTNFESLSGWGQYHGGTGYIQNSFPGMDLRTNTTASSWSQIICSNDWGGNFEVDLDCQYKALIFFLNPVYAISRFGIGVTQVADGTTGFCFEINAGNIYACAVDDPNVIKSASLGSLSAGFHCFEIIYTASTKTAQFLIDGVVVYTITHTFSDGYPEIMMTFYVANIGAHDVGLSCYNAQFQLNL
jgi:hypothetical protein